MLPSDVLLPVLLVVAGVMIACQAGGWAARGIRQPPVIGEIVVGVALGPSLLGWLAPGLQQRLFPSSVLSITSALGNLALLTFLFLVGLELDLSSLRKARRGVVSVSLGSMLLPLALGAGLSAAMYPQFAPPGVGRLPFVLFVAVALSITAFPVLARLLADRSLQTTHLGSFVMAAAAADDAIAWCLLTAVVALNSNATPLKALLVITLIGALTMALMMVRRHVKDLLLRAGRRSDELVLVALCAGLWLTASATDWIGVHPAFGAFIFGAITPRDIPAVERSAARIRAVFVPVLLPLYFVDAGLHTDLANLTWGQWGWAVAILAVAVVGKWGGAAGAARLAGDDWRRAATLGTLLNCRGLTELVVLGIGRQIGVITPDLYTIMVLMAVVTTAATAPVLDRLIGDDPRMAPQPPHLPDQDVTCHDPASSTRPTCEPSGPFGPGRTVQDRSSHGPEPVLETVLTRRSTSHLADPAPGPDEIISLVQAAATAPDHGLLRPWRLIIIEGQDRALLGEALREAAPNPEQAQRAATTPFRAPLILAIVFHPQPERTKVPEWEQLAAAVAMTQTLLLLLHSRGWGTIWRTGPALEAPQIRDHLDLGDNEKLLGWLYIGTRPDSAPDRPRQPFDVRTRISRPRQTADR